ncbi:MAG: hypothetical protein EZS28_007829 [Streblomastix strix]|uniref:SPRY domain-containing protein n=1 Tax=Streblomastix strix TaxID=222440 RepID=A0A5J4WQF3_9EUKA|nr:MAG: hypothetical protein EZS28_007829 [Streblomastix strix]
MEESSERTNRNSAIASATSIEGIANIPQLSNDLRSTNVDLHYHALQRLLIAVAMDPQNIEVVKQQDIIGILSNFLVSEVRPEIQELSNAIIGMLGVHGRHRRKHSRASASGWALVQIILNSDEILSRQGTEALCKLIVVDEQIRDAMLSKRFVDLVLETLTDQKSIKKQTSSSSEQEQEDESEPIFVKVGLLTVVQKLAEEIENPIILGSFIPLLEEIKKNGEKEMIKKARTILGCLQQQGITAPQSNELNENDEKIRQLEETNRRQEETIRKLDEEKEREKIEKDENRKKISDLEQKNEQNKIKITELQRKDEENKRKDEENKRKDEENKRKITDLERQLADSKQKPIINNQIVSQPKSDEIPVSITDLFGTYTKKKGEFTYTSTYQEYKTFPISPDVSKGVCRCEMKINKVGDNHVGIMKSGLNVPFGKSPGHEHYCKDCKVFYKSGKVGQNSQYTDGNQQMKDGDLVSIEVNMDASPRTAHLFINGQQQPVFVSGVPESVQFWYFLNFKGDSLTVLSLKKLTAPSITKIPNESEVKWG